jgi:hypothetical protein
LVKKRIKKKFGRRFYFVSMETIKETGGENILNIQGLANAQ